MEIISTVLIIQKVDRFIKWISHKPAHAAYSHRCAICYTVANCCDENGKKRKDWSHIGLTPHLQPRRYPHSAVAHLPPTTSTLRSTSGYSGSNREVRRSNEDSGQKSKMRITCSFSWNSWSSEFRIFVFPEFNAQIISLSFSSRRTLRHTRQRAEFSCNSANFLGRKSAVRSLIADGFD